MHYADGISGSKTASLGHPTDGHKGVQQLAVQLDETWKAVASRFEESAEVNICHDGKYPSLTISSLEKLEEPPSLNRLNSRVRQLLPPVDLTELLLEIDARTGFTREFTHVSESGARAQDLHISLCAVLMAEARNIGLEPLIKHNIPALTRHRLNWVKQNYLRAETLVSANVRMVDFQSTLELAGHWGGGEVASADGMRFVTPVKTVNSGPNRKYFGSGRGITWYNFVSDQYSGFHGTLRDSIFVLEGLLEQQTGLNPVEIMTDTAGIPTDARAYQYAGALYVHATGGYFEGGTEIINLNLNNELRFLAYVFVKPRSKEREGDYRLP